jgi:glycosyltransferase involved in cell wall biosynthesis
MKILLWARGHFDVVVQLANALAHTDDVFLFIQTEKWEKQRHESIFSLDIPHSAGVFAEHERVFVRTFSHEMRALIDPRIKVYLVNFPSIRIKHPANLMILPAIVAQVKRIQPDVVNVHGVNLHYLLTVPFLSSIPIVFTVHDYLPHTGEEAWQCQVFNSLIAHSGADIIVYGRFQRQEFIEQFRSAAGRVKVTKMGVLDIYRHWSQQEVREEDGVVLFFGRISPYKGLKYLIGAASMVQHTHSRVRIIIAGKGDMSAFKNLVEDKKMYEIYNQHIPNELTARLFQQASIVVLPYTDATQSAVLMTAFAFEKPVIVTRVGGIAETVEDKVTGFVIPPCNEKALARAISVLVKDRTLRAFMKKNIGTKAGAEFSWKRIASETRNIYTATAERRVGLRAMQKRAY